MIWPVKSPHWTDPHMSRRLDLRQFQQDLSNRMQEKGQTGKRVTALGVEIGSELWLVEMDDIGEVHAAPPMTAVPLAKPWYCGVANVRGSLYSIVDLSAYMGYGNAQKNAHSRVLLIAPRHGFNTGLLVSRVLGLRNPRNWRRSEEGSKVLHEDSAGQIWRQLNIPELLRQPEFLHAGI